MPKPPNLAVPVAAIRHQLGMKREDFAQFIGHGAAMLKQIEAGRKRMSDELRDKISRALPSIPAELLVKDRWSKQDREQLRGMSVAAFAGPEPATLGLEPLMMLPDVMAVYFALLSVGVDPKLSLIPLRREIARTLARWSGTAERLDSAYQTARHEIWIRLFAERRDAKDVGRAFCDQILAQLVDTKTFAGARKAHDDWVAKMEKAFSRSPAHAAKEIEEQIRRSADRGRGA